MEALYIYIVCVQILYFQTACVELKLIKLLILINTNKKFDNTLGVILSTINNCRFYYHFIESQTH